MLDRDYRGAYGEIFGKTKLGQFLFIDNSDCVHTEGGAEFWEMVVLLFMVIGRALGQLKT